MIPRIRGVKFTKVCGCIRGFDANGKCTYFEDDDGDWIKYEYDDNGNEVYRENGHGNWIKHEYDADGRVTYYESSSGKTNGVKR